jgi:hypothetical protein
MLAIKMFNVKHFGTIEPQNRTTGQHRSSNMDRSLVRRERGFAA